MAFKHKPPTDPRGAHARVYWQIIDSPAWRTLGASSVKLYIELRRKLTSSSNGNINATLSDLRRYNWRSSATLARALRELVAAGLIAVTRQGGIAYGQRVCTLYRFTDEASYDWPKLHIEASPATHDWQKLDTLAKAKAAPKNTSGLQKVKRDASENEASKPFYASDSEVVAVSTLQKVKRKKNGQSAAKPRRDCVPDDSTPTDKNSRHASKTEHLVHTATPGGESAPPGATATGGALTVDVAGPAGRQPPPAAAGGVVAESGATHPTGKRRTRADPWTPEKLAELRAYREAHGLGAAVAHFGVTRQRICLLLPGGRAKATSQAAGD